MKKFSAFIKWLLWDFSGLRFAWGKLRPPTDTTSNKRNPATFFIWVVGIYVAFFGVASQRYENKLDRIENRVNALLPLIVNKETRNNAFGRIGDIQRMSCPIEPNVFQPHTNLKSLFGKEMSHKLTIDFLKGVVVDFKSMLECLFRSNRPLVPKDSVHLFQAIPTTRSEVNRPGCRSVATLLFYIDRVALFSQ